MLNSKLFFEGLDGFRVAIDAFPFVQAGDLGRNLADPLGDAAHVAVQGARQAVGVVKFAVRQSTDDFNSAMGLGR